MAAVRRVSSPTLIGRREELATIRSALSEIVEGRPWVIVIGGEGGVGKSRLIEEATADSGDRVRVLTGHCLALGTELPYLPFAEIIRDLLRESDAETAAAMFGPAAAELARLVPEISEVVPARTAAASADSELQRLRLFEAVLRVSERIAGDRPTVFVFEDLQWIDPASLQLLTFLAHSIRRGDVVLIVTIRTEAVEPASTIVPFLAELERGSNVLRIELERLDREATRRQVAAILDDAVPEDIAARIWELGDGNPLFTEELVATGDLSRDTESPRLRDLLGARTAQLTPEVLRVLRVAAVLGRSIDSALLAEVTGLEPAAVEAAMEAGLAEQELVRSGDRGGSIRFRHELVRQVIAEQLAAPEARAVHAAYAAALEARPAADPSELAYHWDAAGDAARALAWHARAGYAAEARHAYVAGLGHYRRVLELWPEVPDAEQVAGAPRPRFLQRASTAAARAGQHDRAIELARDYLADADGDDDLTELVRSSLRWYLWEAGRSDEALAEARNAVGKLSTHTSARWRANAMAHLAGLLFVHDEVEEARQQAEAALAVAQAAEAAEERVLASGVIGLCLLLEGELDAGIDKLSEALEAARRIEAADAQLPPDRLHDRRHPAGVVLAATQLAAAYELADRPEDAVRAAEAGYRRAVEQGVARTYGSTLRAAGARGLFRLGRWDDALEIIDDALHDGASSSGRVALLAVSARVHVARGEDAEADAILRTADDDVAAATAGEIARWLAVARGERLLWSGRPLEAVAAIASAYAEADEAPRGAALGQVAGLDASLPQLLALAARGGADLALQERAGSTEATASQLSVDRVRAAIRRAQRRPGLAASWAPELALAQAELARAEHGPGPRAVARWQKAVAATSGRPYAQAYARWRLASALLGDRRRTKEAAVEIEQAASLAGGLRAAPLQAAISALAERAGLGPGSSGRAAGRPFGLTEREVEVLGLLAAGLGNNDIADRLFISPKTASVHVSNIYGKLGVESRVAAATVAHELGLAVDPDTPERAPTK